MVARNISSYEHQEKTETKNIPKGRKSKHFWWCWGSAVKLWYGSITVGRDAPFPILKLKPWNIYVIRYTCRRHWRCFRKQGFGTDWQIIARTFGMSWDSIKRGWKVGSKWSSNSLLIIDNLRNKKPTKPHHPFHSTALGETQSPPVELSQKKQEMETQSCQDGKRPLKRLRTKGWWRLPAADSLAQQSEHSQRHEHAQIEYHRSE